ncbi:MAG: hypothetical protein Q8J78_16340 [Moraxellaceae bacterium]|nr:hypothetical protein [Moraxellaceae bacterium]
MSRLWNKTRLRLYLAPGHIQLAAVAGYWKPAVVGKHEALKAGESAIGMLEALDEVVTREWLGAQLEVVLSAAVVRCFWRPWDEGCLSVSDMNAVAAVFFEKQFAPLSASEMVLSFGKLRFEQPQLVVAVERTFLERITQWSRARGLHLRRVEPLPLVVWNRFESALQVTDRALVVVETERATLLGHDAGILSELHVRPCFGANEVALRQAFGAMLPAQFRIFAARGESTPALLDLRSGPGFLQGQDRTFAFSLCGVF